MQLSIIIPTLNEADHIGTLVYYLQQHTKNSAAEIIVSDGGSTDETVKLARAAGAIIINSPQQGRAAQMNAGAAAASGDVLYFLHADTVPPATFFNDIMNAVASGNTMGRYRTRFNSHKWYLKINAWFTRFDWFVCMGGDNSLFITKDLFDADGGFQQDMQIMEEYEFCERVRKAGCNYKVMRGEILVSARKYDTNSWWNVQMANRRIVRMYRKGCTQQEMKDQYRKMLRYR
jgi:rSAM/selenodomain-associated transferase 2